MKIQNLFELTSPGVLENDYPLPVEFGDRVVADIFFEDFPPHLFGRKVDVFGEGPAKEFHVGRHLLFVKAGLSEAIQLLPDFADNHAGVKAFSGLVLPEEGVRVAPD